MVKILLSHLRMNTARQIKQIVELVLSMKVENSWLLEIEADLQEIGIKSKIIKNRCAF